MSIVLNDDDSNENVLLVVEGLSKVEDGIAAIGDEIAVKVAVASSLPLGNDIGEVELRDCWVEAGVREHKSHALSQLTRPCVDRQKALDLQVALLFSNVELPLGVEVSLEGLNPLPESNVGAAQIR